MKQVIMPEVKILGIGGSPRKGGNTDILLRRMLEAAGKEGIMTEAVFLRDYQYQPCIGCEKCRKDDLCTGLNDGMQLIYPKVIESRGLIMVSPTHNYNVTAWIKAFIDRLYCFYTYTNDHPRGWSSKLAGQGRKAVLGVIGEQTDPDEAIGLTLQAMKLPLEALGYEIVDELPVIGLFQKGKINEEPATLQKAGEIGVKLARTLKTG
jgi:multimeric flavodoxin WrbA